MQNIEVPHSDWDKFISDFNKIHSDSKISIFEIAANGESSVVEDVILKKLIIKKSDNSFEIILDLEEDEIIKSDYVIDRVIKISTIQNDNGKISRLEIDSLNQNKIVIKFD